MLRFDYSHLNTEEKILLVEELWNSIEKDTAIRLTRQQKQLLTKRENEVTSGKVKPITWQQVKKGLKRK